MKKFITSDIHGSFRSLKQCLEKSNFDYENDLLINLGDNFDGWSEVDLCISELLKIKNLINIRGNHDQWALDFLEGRMTNENTSYWFKYGGEATYNCYKDGTPKEHLEFLKSSILYYEMDGNLFVHAGIIPNIAVNLQDSDILLWDRKLVWKAYENQNKKKLVDAYEEVFVGHTPLQNFKSTKFDPMVPQRFTNITLMDTGCAFKGCLSMMNIETREVFSSDPSYVLYPNENGRNEK